MRTVLVGIAMWSRVAAADSPLELALAHEPHAFLDGHLQLVLLAGMEAGDDGAVFDWGTARFVMKLYWTDLDGKRLRSSVGADLRTQGIAHPTIGALAVAKPLVAYAVTPALPRHGEDLLFATYLASPDGTVDLLAFYVDDGGVDDAATWRTLARQIAASALPGTARSAARWATIFDYTIAVPAGGTLLPLRYDGGRVLELGPDRVCFLYHPPRGWSEIPKYAKQIADLSYRWNVWTGLDTLEHAATVTEDLSVFCHAPDATALARLRAVVETLHR